MAEPRSEADRALKKLADQLECAICLDSYTNPRLLQCFHVFCKNCLEETVIRNQQMMSVCCPTCRQSTPLPAQGVSDLRPAFHIHNLFEIQDSLKKVVKGKEGQETLCEKCKKFEASGFCRDCNKLVCEMCIEVHQSWEEFSSHEVISLDQLKSDTTNLVSPAKKVLFCSKHPEKELSLFCETDEELICQDCIIRAHRDHQYDLVREAFPKHRDAIASHLQPIEQQLSTVDEAIQALDTNCKQITDQRAAIEVDIQERIQQLHEALEVRKTQLIGQLDQLTQRKLKSLSSQRNDLELIQTRLGSCLEFANKVIITGSMGEILGMKKLLVQQVGEMSIDLNPDQLLPHEHADIKFTVQSSKLIQACQQYGFVYSPMISPEKCHITGEGAKVAKENELSVVTLHVFDSEGDKCDKPLPNTAVSCELVCCSDRRIRYSLGVKHTKANEHEIVYLPTTRGRHELHVRVQGQHISGSPFTIAVQRNLQTLGSPITTITGLNKPRDVAVGKKGHIVVAECRGHCISIYSLDGEKIKTFGKKGTAPGQFNKPRGVAVDRHGNILVVDGQNHRIQMFTGNGKFVMSIGRHGDKPCEFSFPVGIGIAPDAKVYVCDNGNQRIQILNPDLTYSSSFSCHGRGCGQFPFPVCGPWDVAFDSHGNVFVADCGSHRIQVFTNDGQFLRTFGRKGSGNEEFNCPASIAISSEDVLYVADSDNHRISLFTSQGNFLRSLGTAGKGPGQFNDPRGIAVDKEGLVYVSDYNNGRIQVF